MYSNKTANSAFEGAVWAATDAWTALQVGTAPVKGRAWIEIQVKGPTALALAYANKNTDGTFTSPTGDTRAKIIIPANSVKIIPVSDTLVVYGRAIAKAGNTDNGSKIAVVEFK